MLAIINASPLIYLGKIGALYLLPKLFTSIYTSSTVKEEVLKQEHAPEYASLTEAFDSWLQIRKPINEPLTQKLLLLQIHTGEAEVLSLAYELSLEKKSSIVIIDDLVARDIAKSLGLVVTGTIGILLKAYEQHITSNDNCRILLDRLLTETSFRISARIYAAILKRLENR